MSTLKLKLLAASMFACSAAFAQTPTTQNYGAPTRTPTNGANQNPAPATYTRTTYGQDSYVLQHGDSQYANVDQNGYYNTADVYQGRTNAASSGNNATQRQTNDGRDGQGARNIAYIAQDGTNSDASQTQTGTGNVASTVQGTGTHNYATQTQTGMNNSADISQMGSYSTAIQTQDGNNDTARITQGNAYSNYAEQRQSGGNGNQANTTQSAYYGTASYTEQMGNNNRSNVNQRYQ